MSDVSDQLQIPEARLEQIEQGDDAITLHFSRVNLVREMEGTFEDSLWYQACNLIVTGITIEGDLPACPCDIKGGDLSNNIYTYRDHAPLPIDWRGSVGCTFTILDSGATFSIDGSSLRLEQLGHPRYIKHIKKT